MVGPVSVELGPWCLLVVRCIPTLVALDCRVSAHVICQKHLRPGRRPTIVSHGRLAGEEVRCVTGS